MEHQLPLRDIHIPEAIGWWPPAIGWWLMLFLIPLLCFLVYWLYKKFTRKTAVKSAKKILVAIGQDKDSDDLHKLRQLSALLRRVAVSVAPRAESAGLSGQTWLQYLDRSVKGSPFTDGAGRCLADAHFRKSPPVDLDIAVLSRLCDEWIKAQQ
jgi:hypothetical protein